MTWMPTFLWNRTDVEFTGYDIVQANIDSHRKKFEKTNWKFEVEYIQGVKISQNRPGVAEPFIRPFSLAIIKLVEKLDTFSNCPVHLEVSI